MKITLCGSVAFYDEMLSVKEKLEKMGHEVKLPPHELKNDKGKMIPVKEYYQRRKESSGDEKWIWDRKEEAMKMHFDKMNWSDGVLILNYDKNDIKGYIGGNTLMEIGIALFLKKKIYLLNPIPEMPYKEEILGARPVILNSDLNKITELIQ